MCNSEGRRQEKFGGVKSKKLLFCLYLILVKCLKKKKDSFFKIRKVEGRIRVTAFACGRTKQVK